MTKASVSSAEEQQLYQYQSQPLQLVVNQPPADQALATDHLLPPLLIDLGTRVDDICQSDAAATGEAGVPMGIVPVDPNERRYCLCNEVSYGEMVGCDRKAVSYITNIDVLYLQ